MMLRLFILILWLGTVSFMLIRIVVGQNQSRYKELSIASVTGVRGSVLAMSQESAAWQSVGQNFYIYNHDLISTGSRSWAKLELHSGDQILVGPDSQIRIQASAALPNNMALSLIKGSIDISRPESDVPRPSRPSAGIEPLGYLQVNAGQYTIDIAPRRKQLNIRREQANSDTKIVSRESSFEVRDHLEGRSINYRNEADSVADSSIVLPALGSAPQVQPIIPVPPQIQVASPSPAPVEIARPSPVASPPPANLHDSAAGLNILDETTQSALQSWRLMPSDLDLWVLPGDQAKSWQLPFARFPDELLRAHSEYTVSLNLRLSSSHNQHLTWQYTGQFPENFALSESNLQNLKVWGNGPVQQSLNWELSLRVEIKGFQPLSIHQKYPMQLMQPELGGGAMLAVVPQARQAPRSGGLVTRRQAQFPIQLLIPNKDHIRRFTPFLTNSANLLYRSSSSLPEKGIFVVIDSKIVASLAHSGPLDYARLGKQVGADLIFSGESRAFLGDRIVSAGSLDEMAARENLFFIYQNQVIALDQRLLETHPIIKDFLTQFNPLFFSSQIQVLYTK